MNFRILIALLGMLIGLPAWGEEGREQAVSGLIVQAQEKQLARHPYWAALLHYRPGGLGMRGESEIESADFFLSPRGKIDPEAELRATITALFDEAGQDGDAHAQCRFVARYRWLQKVLDWKGAQPPAVQCKQFMSWSLSGHFSSASLIFATGYLSNPASFYGHLLLKFNADRAVSPSSLLDETVNYGAIVPENELAAIYVTKGIFGGYQAAFSGEKFYRMNHVYAEDELRDLWEYELDLSRDEVEQLAAHCWELLHVKFTYYFFDENCAYQMAQLLELILGQPLLSGQLPWSVPGSVFDRLVELRKEGRPVVKLIRKIPSRLSRFQNRYFSLSPRERTAVVELARQDLDFKLSRYQVLPEERKAPVVDTLLDYYEFRIVDDPHDVALHRARRDVLVERMKLPSQSSDEDVADSPGETDGAPPHHGPRPGMVRLGYQHNRVLGDGVELRMRPVYFDHLQLDAGRMPHANLTMFDLQASYFGQGWRLRNLELVNIENMNVARTPLPKDGGWAWRIKFGFMEQDLSCLDCARAFGGGGLGKAFQLSDETIAFGMINLLGKAAYAGLGTVAYGPEVGVNSAPFGFWKYSVSVGNRSYANGTQSSVPQFRWQNRFGSGRDWDVRLNYESHVAQQWLVALSRYW